MSEKSNKRKHTGFVLPRPTKSYCKVCSGEFAFLSQDRRRTRYDCIYVACCAHLKVSLNDAQKSWIFRHYLADGELTVLCKEHMKEFARIGNNVYKELVDLSGQAPDFERPLYDQPDPLAKPKQSRRAKNKKSQG